MSRPKYEEIQCKSVINRVRGMDFKWSVNPYKGCVHSCHYCFARRYHAFMDMNPGEDFSGVVFAKVNAPQVIRWELARPSWKREMVALGTATDPYQPAEGHYRITRGILEALLDYRTPVGIITKGTLVVRDLELLAALRRRAGCTVNVSITTLDEGVWRRLEPGTPHPRKRLEAVRRLAEAGINAGVLIAPVVPGLTDAPQDLEALVREAATSGARFAAAVPLRLQGGTRDHFLSFLHNTFPSLMPRYRRLFPGAHAPQSYRDGLAAFIDVLRGRYGLTGDRSMGPDERQPRQLALPSLAQEVAPRPIPRRV